VESNPGGVEFPERVQSVKLEVCIVNEIKGCVDDVNQSWFCWTSKNAQEDLLHVLVLSTNPLGDQQNTFLEMS
jgi:hypothetical protein